MESRLNKDSIQKLKRERIKLKQTERLLQKEIENNHQLKRSLKISQERVGAMERAMTARRQQAQKLEALGTLSSGIAHEFNNILAVALGNCELAQLVLPSDAPAQPYLKTIATAGQRAKDLVKQVLGFSRKQDHHQTPTLIHVVLNEALKFMRASLPASIEFNSHICRDMCYVMADVVQLHQVIVQLCLDVATAMEETGGVLSVTLTKVNLDAVAIAPQSDLITGSYLEIIIADNGKRVGSDQLNRLCQARFNSESNCDAAGSVFSNINEIIAGHQGLFTAESTIDAGTKFTILLPIISDETDTESHDERPLPKGSERIMFIDDEPDLANAEAKFFTKLGYQVNAFSDCRKAWAEFKSHPSNYDIVITDMTMPQMSGSTLARRMVKLRPDIPIILCSGHSDNIWAKTTQQTGISVVARKPVVFAELSITARRLLDTALGQPSKQSP